MDWRASPLIEAWWGEGRHPFCALLRIPLIPFGIVFGAASALRRAAYERGVFDRWSPPAPTISVGNLTVGGTGKSPMVRWVAETLVGQGRSPLVFSSGFGARADGSTLDEEGAALVRAVPGARIVQGRDARDVVSRAFASPEAPVAVVLDDGFQKLAIRRDLDIVMLDATRPFGDGWPVPAGPLREWPGALRRAGVIVLSRSELVSPERSAALRRSVEERAAGALVIRQRHVPTTLLRSGAAAVELKGAGVFLISAIAHPRAFEETVRSLGARVLGHDALRDHAPLPRDRVLETVARARAAGADLVLCSAKDAPKLESLRDTNPRIEALDIGVRFDDDPAPILERMNALFDKPADVTAQRS